MGDAAIEKVREWQRRYKSANEREQAGVLAVSRALEGWLQTYSPREIRGGVSLAMVDGGKWELYATGTKTYTADSIDACVDLGAKDIEEHLQYRERHIEAYAEMVVAAERVRR